MFIIHLIENLQEDVYLYALRYPLRFSHELDNV